MKFYVISGVIAIVLAITLVIITIVHAQVIEVPVVNATNATGVCVAADVHVHIANRFYNRTYSLAIVTGMLDNVSNYLNEISTLVSEAEESLYVNNCALALRKAIRSMHLSKRVFAYIMRESRIGREHRENMTKIRELSVLKIMVGRMESTAKKLNKTEVLEKVEDSKTCLKKCVNVVPEEFRECTISCAKDVRSIWKEIQKERHKAIVNRTLGHLIREAAKLEIAMINATGIDRAIASLKGNKKIIELVKKGLGKVNASAVDINALENAMISINVTINYLEEVKERVEDETKARELSREVVKNFRQRVKEFKEKKEPKIVEKWKKEVEEMVGSTISEMPKPKHPCISCIREGHK